MNIRAFLGKAALTLLLCLVLIRTAQCQIVITPSDSVVFTVDSLVKKMVGPGVLISNITYNQGLFSKGLGYYTDTSNILNLRNGLVMSTGYVDKIPGPNTSTFLSDQVSGSSIDPDLSGLINSTDLSDLSSIEFDFIPLSDTLAFNFVFGSEEYAFFSCPGVVFNYNDVFGFFVDGPSPQGGLYNKFNVARLPFTNTNTDVVSILNVTSGGCPQACSSNASFFIPNYSNCPANPGSINISYDGFTIKLKAIIPVVPCETYHLKLAIADVRDPWFDSFVIIEEGFITAPSRLSLSARPSYNRFSNAIEGCHPIDVIFRKIQPDTFPETIFYGLYGSADNGNDYTDSLGNPLSGAIVFPPNLDSVVLRIYAVQDSIVDPGEDIVIKIFLPCQDALLDTAAGDSVQIFIDESFDYDLGFNQWYCPGSSVQLNPNPAVPTDQIVWSPSVGLSCTTCLSPFSNPDSSIYYTASITDVATGCMTKDSVLVSTGLVADFASNDTSVCNGSQIKLQLDTTRLQAYGNVAIQWTSQPTILSASLNQSSITVFADGQDRFYSITFTFPGGCVAYDSIFVESTPILSGLTRDTVLCLDTPLLLEWKTFAFDSLVWSLNPYSATWADSIFTLLIDQIGIYQVSATAFVKNCPYGLFFRASVLGASKTDVLAEYQNDDAWIKIQPGDLISAFSPVSLRFQPAELLIGSAYRWQLFSSDLNVFSFSNAFLWETEILSSGPHHIRLIQSLVDTTQSSCFSFDSLSFQIIAPSMPNMISPNGDGMNDYFSVGHFFKNQPISLAIFNRWGRKVYENLEYKDDWQADNLSGGTYFYFITLSGTDINYQGWIQVLK